MIDPVVVTAKVLPERIDAMLSEVATARDLWDQDNSTTPTPSPAGSKTVAAGMTN